MSDRILLTSDWHIPFHKSEYVDLLYYIAEELNIKDIAVIGDFWDCDNYSHYTSFDIGVTFQNELANVGKELKRLVDAFDGVYLCVGNHEARFLAANATQFANGHLKYQQMMNLTGVTEGYTVTDNRWMLLNGEWRLTHPKNYNTKKLSVANRLADRYRMNIVNTHGHYTAGTPPGNALMKPATHIVRDRDTGAEIDAFKVCDIGGLFDKSKLEYLTLWDTTYPTLQPGIAIYDHGEVTVIDLERYLAEAD